MNERQAGNRLTRQTRSLVYLFILSKEKKNIFLVIHSSEIKQLKEAEGIHNVSSQWFGSVQKSVQISDVKKWRAWPLTAVPYLVKCTFQYESMGWISAKQTTRSYA